MTPTGRDVVVTGVGAVSALGHGVDSLLAAVAGGRSGIAPITRFDTSLFSTPWGAEVKAVGEPPPGAPRSYEEGVSAWDLCLEYALAAAQEALEQAGVGALPRERIGLAFGTGLVDTRHAVHNLADTMGDALCLYGPRLTVSTACSSSTGAIGLALDLLALGAADIVVAGGADVLSPSVFAGFYALDVLSPAPCAPFSLPLGTTLGEGAGFLVLERRETARSRGARRIVALRGYGLSADGFHETSPDPEGDGVTRAVRAALADGAVDPLRVDYVNAHGSGTEANDRSEALGIRRALDQRVIPVSSTKGALGHAQGAAGALESIVTILGMAGSFVPPTLHHGEARKAAPDDAVPGPAPRPGEIRHALCLNSAFGGSNAALVLSREDDPGAEMPPGEPSVPPGRWPVEVIGLGLVGPDGPRTGSLGPPGPGGRAGDAPAIAIEDFAPRTDPRGLDRSARMLIAAASLSLSDADIRVRGALRARTGLIYGALRPSPESVARFGRSIDARGLRGLSAAAFARIVLNAPAGFCSKELGLRGPHTAVTCGGGSGLLAILVAAEILASREEIDVMIGASVDERAEGESAETMGEWATAVSLGKSGTSVGVTGQYAERPAVRLAGWGLAGPADPGAAIARASHMAGRPVSASAPVFDGEDYGVPATAGAWAAPSALAFCDAVALLRQGGASSAVVTSKAGAGVTLAAILRT